ncbi:phage holin family protein [Alcanivorax sp. JB21]|uniref:phage holin family protein n=1 Tax=Alcanivorax limicola TaxID=2874102 RepID=UPI001CBCCAB1|nr:phage holin family protein [Alcanivorax limicola]MBZ2187604.1 phage holin family protein [Alcanivorax limicola]
MVQTEREPERPRSAQDNDPVAPAAGEGPDGALPDAGDDQGERGPSGTGSDFRQLGKDASGLARDMLALFVAELRLSLSTILVMIALAAMSGLLVAGAFIFLGGSAAWMLVTTGLASPVIAGLLLVVFLLTLTGLAYIWTRRLSKDLMFRGTRNAMLALTTLRWTLPEEEQGDNQTDSGPTPGRGGAAESAGPQNGTQRSPD